MPTETRCRKVKIFGERNTGTHAIKALIERNSDAMVLPSTLAEVAPDSLARKVLARARGAERLRELHTDRVFANQPLPRQWKHTAPCIAEAHRLRDVLVILTSRHPASWLLALHARPYHARTPVPPAFDAFLGMPWRTRRRDRVAATLTPIQLWNVKHRAYLALHEALVGLRSPVALVTLERFATDQHGTYADLAPWLDGALPQPSIVRESTKDPGRDHTYYQDHFANQRWAAELGSEARARIDREVDWEVAARFGYAPLG